MKTVREEKIGKTTLRLLERGGGFVGIAIHAGKAGAPVEGEDQQEVWLQLRQIAGRAHEEYFGFDEARRRFLALFPGGFGSEKFQTIERNYKLAAKAKLDAVAPVEEAATGTGFASGIKAALNATNLIHQIEKARTHDMLRSPDGDKFIQASARFALGDDDAFSAIAGILKDHSLGWTGATYLPFLWAPDRHMFLKPMVTCDYARRVGHSFADDYRSEISLDVYAALLDLTATTRRELAPLNPVNNIDLQSFIWAIGEQAAELGQVTVD